MLDKNVRSTNVFELTETDLGDDSTELSAGGRDTVRGRAIAGRKNFSRYYECCNIWAKILEEIGKAV